MEDAHVIIDGFCSKPEQGMFAVYDGHGGRDAVEVVARNLHNLLQEELNSVEISGLKNETAIRKAFRQAYLRTDKLCLDANCHYVGSTVLTCLLTLINGKKFIVTANAGDTRAVLCRDNKSKRISYDHKASDEGEAKRIIDMGGTISNRRANGILSVSRSVGDHAFKKFIVSNPYVSFEEVTPDLEFVILACDGLWDVMEDEEAVSFVKEKLSTMSNDLKGIAKRLINIALDRGSSDNISIMIVVL